MTKVDDHMGSATAKPDRPKRALLRAVLASAVVPAIGLAVGFALFMSHIHKTPDISAPKGDGIVVLTGGFARLEPAADLLKQGAGSRLLVSGVNPDTSAPSLRYALGLSEQQFACCVDIDYRAVDTIGNAREIARWVDAREYSSIVVVTNDYHMPRSLSEISRLDQSVELIAYPVSNPPEPDETLIVRAKRYQVLLAEYGKFLASQLRRAFE